MLIVSASLAAFSLYSSNICSAVIRSGFFIRTILEDGIKTGGSGILCTGWQVSLSFSVNALRTVPIAFNPRSNSVWSSFVLWVNFFIRFPKCRTSTPEWILSRKSSISFRVSFKRSVFSSMKSFVLFCTMDVAIFLAVVMISSCVLCPAGTKASPNLLELRSTSCLQQLFAAICLFNNSNFSSSHLSLIFLDVVSDVLIVQEWSDVHCEDKFICEYK